MCRMSSPHSFLFHAEDGIRGGHVTGIQTCALPIWAARPRAPQRRSRMGTARREAAPGPAAGHRAPPAVPSRMELAERGRPAGPGPGTQRSEEHTSELQSRGHLVCRLLLEKKNTLIRET